MDMPHKAFLHKKSLLDQFRDDHKHTGVIQSMRAEHTWNNPLTRRKRTKKLNGWIKSFAGKDHIRKLSRFNAVQAHRHESVGADGVKVKQYVDIFELPDGKIIKALNKCIRCPRKFAATQYITGWVENYPEENLPGKYTVFYENAKGIEDNFFTDDIQDLPNYQISGPVPSEKSVVGESTMKTSEKEYKHVSPYMIDTALPILKNEYGWNLATEDDVAEFIEDYWDAFVKAYNRSEKGGDGPIRDGIEAALSAEDAKVTRAEYGSEFESKKNEVRVLPNPTIIYKGPIEDAKKACHYFSKILADKGLGWGRVSWQAPKDGEFHYGHPEKDVYTVTLRGSNDLIKDSFAVYKDVFGNDFWNNCDASPDGWVNPQDIAIRDVATESKNADEKLGYEKGHKNSKGEDAPWVIRSHEDNRILASFATEDEAKKHLQRMKQYSKGESKKSEGLSNEKVKDSVKFTATEAGLEDYLKVDSDGAMSVTVSLPINSEKLKTVRWVIDSNEGTIEEYLDTEKNLVRDFTDDQSLVSMLTLLFQTARMSLHHWLPKKSEALFNKEELEEPVNSYISDVFADLVVSFHWGEDGAKKFLDKYNDVILTNYAEGEMSAYETARYIDRKENPYPLESKKKQESKKNEGHLDLVDTIVVPKWLWDAFYFADEYGETLNDEEEEILADFKAKYADAKYHLETPEEEADFRSHNDFDNYGGPCYDINVYEWQ